MTSKLRNDNVIATITWTIEDIEQFLEEKGYEVSAENIDTMLNNRLTKTLEDRSIEEGWNITDTIFYMCKDQLK